MLKDDEIINKINKINSNKKEEKLKKIIKTKNLSIIYKYALNTLDLDFDSINTLADEIIKSKKAKYMYYFARDVKNAPIDKLADAVIKIKNQEYIYKFIRDVKNAPIKLFAYIEYTKNDTFVNNFLNHSDVTDKINIINFIKEYKYNIKKYKNFSTSLLNIMKENLEIYRNILSVYIEYIINPNCLEEEHVKLYQEYLNLEQEKELWFNNKQYEKQ